MGRPRQPSPVDPLRDPLPQAIRRIGLPAAVGLFFQTLFNVTDTWYAGFISTEALAALAVSFPIFFIIIALLIGLGSGSQALIAMSIGGGDKDRAVRLWGQALWFAMALGLAVGLYGLFFSEPLFRLIGAEGEVLDEARRYLLPILLAAPLFLLIAACNGILSGQGDTAPYRNALVCGALANVGLNPLFMFGLGPFPAMGVLGIAIATIVIQVAQSAYLWHMARRSPLGRRLSPAMLIPQWELARSLAAQAGPVALTMATTGIGLFTVTYFMGRHGDAAVAAYGIALRIEQLAMLPMIGLTSAALTLSGQNLGAGQIERVRKSAWAVHLTGMLVAALGIALAMPLRHQLMAGFTDDPEVIELGAAYLAVALLILPAYALLAIGSATLQGMRLPVLPMYIGIARHVVGPWLILSLFDIVLGIGLPGIYAGVFTVAWLGGLATLFVLWRRLPARPPADLTRP